MQGGLPDHTQHQRLPTCLAAGDLTGGFSPGAAGVDPRSHSRRITTRAETAGFEIYRAGMAIFLEAVFYL